MNWLVLSVKPKSEHIAASDARENGYEPFYPLVQPRRLRPHEKRPVGRPKTRTEKPQPLIPGYIFIGYWDGMEWQKARSLKGAVDLLYWEREQGTEWTPAKVSQEDIDAIRADHEAGIERVSWDRLSHGDHVDIVRGNGIGYSAVVQKIARAGKPDEAIKVLVDRHGYELPIWVPRRAVEKV